ncbi:MAG: type II secretion system F family protein [archaeon]|jgi:flagellar protein FlaJ|nr:type II secretion system F family protein [archaeon]
MTEALKKAVQKEIEMLGEYSLILAKAENSSQSERRLMLDGADSLIAQIKKVNNSIPVLLNRILIEPEGKKKSEKETKKPAKEIVLSERLSIKSEEKEKMLGELNINERLFRKVGKKQGEEKEAEFEFKAARGYLKMANRFFLDSANKLIKKGYFLSLAGEIKKSNLDMLFGSYVAMILFTTFLSVFAGLLLAIILMIIIGFNPIILLLIIVVPIGVFSALYYYPSAERSSISKKIDDELPFAVIHMSSISGSGIEPTEIFKIIGLSKEYPFLKGEIRKILNQINIYGYDLVTALNGVSKSTSSDKLAELLNGLSATISSGGSLSDFFQKRADTLLVSYKLEKARFVKVAETFMDVYISVVIAAPMILMLMLVMISVSGIQTGFTPYQLTFITIGGVALINIVFLGFLQMKASY